MTYSLVFASRRRNQSNPAAVDPVRFISRKMIAPNMARIDPLGMGSRMMIFPFHFGSSTSSQSLGASAAERSWELYAMTSGVRYVPYQRSVASCDSAGIIDAHVGR